MITQSIRIRFRMALCSLAVLVGAVQGTAQEGPSAYVVKNIHTGSDPRASRSGHFVAAGDIAFFAADDRDHGRELWRSDGTPAGTWMVKDINPGTADGLTDRLWYPWNTAVVGDVLYFLATDGTDADWRLQPAVAQ